ncbi:MAG: carbohydrate ABC transporter permease [Clostridia bacterium]|nr:carbohydrate ABC transporter permease [Clostridia bacterium]
MNNKKLTTGKIICGILLAAAIVITVFPLYLMIATSTKSTFQFAVNFWGIAVPPRWDNYSVAWDAIGKYVFNTIKVSAMTVFFVTTVSVLSGYAFAKMKFKGKNLLFAIIMMFKMLPATLVMIPNFLNAYKLGLYNTHLGAVLPLVAGLSFMPMMLSKSFFQGLPDDIFEAIRIDGAGEFKVITHLLIPLSKPIVLTCALFTFFHSVSQYTWPLVILRDDSLKTVAIGLTSFAGAYGTDYGVQMAAYTIVTLSLMVLVSLTMKTYVNGITAGAVKG